MTAGADMIVFNSSTLKATDKHSAGYQYPSADDQQDLTTDFATLVRDGTYASFTVRRPLDTNDKDDFLIQLDKQFEGGWAAHTDSTEET